MDVIQETEVREGLRRAGGLSPLILEQPDSDTMNQGSNSRPSPIKPDAGSENQGANAPRSPVNHPGKHLELILDALKKAISEAGEHRLFRSGKLPGLFPARGGSSAEAARRALAEGLIETIRTETKGKWIVEWVRPTPKAIRYIHDNDSSEAILRELRDVIGATRAGVPLWMNEAKEQVERLATQFERQGNEILRRLDDLTARVEAALRRAEVGMPRVPESIASLIPWATDTLIYLDRRLTAGASTACPLRELFLAMRETRSSLDLPDFHSGLRRLHDARAIRLTPGGGDVVDPEYAIFINAEACHFASR